ncbi:MAG: hypothetical protein ACRDMV_02575 [Streptosporangiales bacterium]
MLGLVALSAASTEAFAWVVTGFGAGYAAGSVLAAVFVRRRLLPVPSQA